MRQFRFQTHHRIIMIVILILLTAALPFITNAYYVKLATRMMIFGLAAVSVDLLLGYCGLVSFGHAAFIGVGAYSVGILADLTVESAFIAWPLAIAFSALAAAAIGFVSLRTKGLYFIMITLAFAQMLYHLFRSLRSYGGADGFSVTRSDFGGLINLYSPTEYFFLVLVLLLVCLFLVDRLRKAPFGALLLCARDDAGRLEALGTPVYPYFLTAYAISGAIAGLAGILFANLDGYASPDLAGWHVSGELLVMVILGGSATLFGPIIGAVIYLLFATVLAGLTEHWMIIFGPILILRVLLAKNIVVTKLLARLRHA
jgi:branched-chain amino acid transport system permease protein